MNENNELLDYKSLNLNYIEYEPTFYLKRNDDGFMLFYRNYVESYDYYKDELCFEKDLRYELSQKVL